MTRITLGDLAKKVTLEDVLVALEATIKNTSGGSHEVDLGDFGHHDVDCDNSGINEDVADDVLQILIGKAE